MKIAVGAGLAGAAMLLLVSGVAIAQSPVEIQATAPEKPPQIRIVEPTPATREATRPREADFYREDVRVRHQPAFIEPFVGQTQGGTKYGLSGWTSPSTPVGSLVSQEPWARTGWFAPGHHGRLGFAPGSVRPAGLRSPLNRPAPSAAR